jgi:DNA mismatch repair protein MSH4
MTMSIDGSYGTFQFTVIECTSPDPTDPIVRPEFTGTLAIKSGRHPILETVRSAGSFVSNDVFANESACFQIIQGPVSVTCSSPFRLTLTLLQKYVMCL